jgi:hypothetical protein
MTDVIATDATKRQRFGVASQRLQVKGGQFMAREAVCS